MIEVKCIKDKIVFKYREILGEIIFVYVVGGPNISYTMAELSTFSDNPE